MLVSYKKSGKAFHTVHKLITKYLSLKMSALGIEKAQKKVSENVKGNLGRIQWWVRIK